MAELDKPLILVLDDSPQNLEIIGRVLSSNGYEPVLFPNANGALDFLSNTIPDLILLDIILPEEDGFSVCRKIKSREDTKEIPVIFLTAKIDPNELVRGFEEGAVDYITKPFNFIELLARIKNHLAVRQMQYQLQEQNLQLRKEIELRKEAESKLRKLATTDGLTGLFNRQYFMEQSRQEVERSRRYERPLSLMMIDADNFKSINDQYGHHVGDLVLQSFGIIGQSIFRSNDLFGRIGGEEFAALLPETDINQARNVAERFIEAVRDQTIEFNEINLSFTVSIGIAMFTREMQTLKDLMRKADTALYIAKESGKNRVQQM